ncbi:sushi, von Willebrand factor type A, EGF and pentraxin domain-containing protein 1-like [Mizuhopecten yessoensis]|uniref:sushi, von Willebrand factor type A, EGF and pentraxin domain-containing protein 1-like n=1 Tax=Mizuhopecten yessoensis TaxID=6573 RepID=UPI000B45CE89|nr:sushi, von Willebrand factor type A, EGF and pentraxin domain-containing protein 1-like [Mizuhopecten yessoensis]
MTTVRISTRYHLLLLFLVMITETRSEDFISTYFQAVNDVDVVGHTDTWTRQEQLIRNRTRCTSLCVASACECASFTYDGATGTCYMFTKTVSSGGGSGKGANKLTECVVPRVIEHSILTDYTGCNATYDCVFGYNATDHNVLTCQANETWAPSGFSCAEIPCPDPAELANGIPTVTTLQVGGVATYTCLSGYINRGGVGDTLTCQLGGTWLGVIDMICKPIVIRYTFYWTTADVLFAGTDAIVWVRMYGAYGTQQVTMPSNMLFERGISESNLTL